MRQNKAAIKSAENLVRSYEMITAVNPRNKIIPKGTLSPKFDRVLNEKAFTSYKDDYADLGKRRDLCKLLTINNR